MRQSKTIIAVGILLLTLLGGGTFFFLHNKSSESPIPRLSQRPGDESASAEFLNAQKTAAYYRDEIGKKPNDPKNYVQLAQLFLQEARVTALHHEYFPKARYLLDEALRFDPNNFDARITRASMLMTLHQFEEARKMVGGAISYNPYNAFAYGVLTDALVELGRYDEAVKACDKMLSIRPDLRSYARAAYLREIHGDLAGARTAMRLAADAGIFGQENREWVLYQLGMLYMNEGMLDTATFIFNGILDERPGYAFANAGLARAENARGNHEEAIRLMEKAFAALPDHVFLEELVDLYRAAGQTSKAAQTTEKVMLEFRDHRVEGWQVDGEFAMFCAKQDAKLDEALACAKRDYERRPENIQALETYAWLLYKNDKSSEAVQYIEQATRLNTRNPVLLFHAGMIYKSAGDSRKARIHLQQALEINPFLPWPYLDIARQTLATRNDIADNR